MFVDPEISTQDDGAQSSRVPVSLPEDPYEAIRQAYLVGTGVESEPFEDPVKTETLESPHIVAPPTYHPLTHTTPILVPFLRRTTCMAMRIPPAMSPSFPISIAEVAAMPDSAFCKRFRSSYDSSPSPTFLVRKRYRGTSELILDSDSEGDELGDEDDDDEEEEHPALADSIPPPPIHHVTARMSIREQPPTPDDDDEEEDEVEASSDSNNESEDVEDKGPTAGDDDLAARDEGLGMRVESFGLRGDEAVPEGQQQATLIVETTMAEWVVVVADKSVVVVNSPADQVKTKEVVEYNKEMDKVVGTIATDKAPNSIKNPSASTVAGEVIGDGTVSDIMGDEIEERRAQLDLAEIVDSMRRGQEPRGDV
nr:hypothetical protein [Tanacetum cinerariifolium]